MESMLDPREPAKKGNVTNPLIGMAISFCVLVASLLAGLVVLCGPSNNKGSTTSAQQVIGWLFLALMAASALGIVVCFLWFLVALIRSSTRD